jgi:hypothetical protein
MDRISGKWSGEFVYGSEYDSQKRGKKVKFIMTLMYDNGIVRGFSIDEEAKEVFSEPAKIEGSFENGVIAFYLTYHKDSIVGEEENAAEYGVGSIQYIGFLRKKIFSKKVYFSGTWDIGESELDSNGRACYYHSSGTWKMEKIEN